MTTPGEFWTLWHGTTRQRAEQIVFNGPDPNYREPASNTREDEQFWTVAHDRSPSQSPLGTARDYALRKAQSSGEGNPAIVELQVPDWLVQIVLEDPIGRFNYQSGYVCFELGCGLDELIAEWRNLLVTIRDVTHE